MKRYDLMQDINTRGTFVVSKACIPHLRAAENPHILTLSPPISLEPQWLGPHIGYTIAKYGMSLCALGLAEEFREAGIASNALWPRTLIATAAVQNLLGGDAAMARVAQARGLRRRRLRDPHPAQPRVHRQHVPVRGRARRGGRDRLHALRVRRGRRAAGRPVRRPRLGSTVVRLLLNLIWLVFGGFWVALGYALAALVMCILIITIPFGIASARMALFCLWPFGRTLVRRPDAGAGSRSAT